MVCISIFECIPASYTNTHPYVHRAVVVCAVVQAVLPLCVCASQAVVKWAQFNVQACVPFLYKNATQLHRRGIRSSWRHFLSFSFPLLFQATPVASSRVFPSIFSFLHLFVHFFPLYPHYLLALQFIPDFFLSFFGLVYKTHQLPQCSRRFTFHQTQNT